MFWIKNKPLTERCEKVVRDLVSSNAEVTFKSKFYNDPYVLGFVAATIVGVVSKYDKSAVSKMKILDITASTLKRLMPAEYALMCYKSILNLLRVGNADYEKGYVAADQLIEIANLGEPTSFSAAYISAVSQAQSLGFNPDTDLDVIMGIYIKLTIHAAIDMLNATAESRNYFE